jgi:hypothetical protein
MFKITKEEHAILKDEYERFKVEFEAFKKEAVHFRKRKMTVDDWMAEKKISEQDKLEYPNARAATVIKSSPLYKALK